MILIVRILILDKMIEGHAIENLR